MLWGEGGKTGLGAESAYLALHERLPQARTPAVQGALGRLPAHAQLLESAPELHGLGALTGQAVLAARVRGAQQCLVGVKGLDYFLPQREKAGSGMLQADRRTTFQTSAGSGSATLFSKLCPQKPE